MLQERERLFGKQVAEQIWASERRNVAVSDALKAIDAQPEASVGERMAQYKQSLGKAYGERTEAYTRAHQQELMDRFLELGSVQKDLGTMTPEQRAEQPALHPQGHGAGRGGPRPVEAVGRPARRAVGAGHAVHARAPGTRRTGLGGELEQQLAALRARYFPDEAETIAEEEASGLFRFSGPRQWGRN